MQAITALTIATTTPIEIQFAVVVPLRRVTRRPNGSSAVSVAWRSGAPTRAATIGMPSNSSVSASDAMMARAISRGASSISSPKYTAAP